MTIDAGTIAGMTNSTLSDDDRQRQLSSYLQLVNKATHRELTDDELVLFNRAIATSNLGGLDALLGTRFIRLGPATAQLELVVSPQHLQPWGLANGGVYCSLGESLGSIAGFVAAGASPAVVGVNNNTDFYRPARAGEIIVSTAEPEYLGRTMQMWRIEHVRKSDSKMLARTNLRVAVLSTSE